MSEDKKSNGKAFISYSRKDKVFVQKLEASLEEYGVVTWVDWEGIPLSADWMAEITSAIESADTFLFVISPDSLASKVCGDELALGLKYNKKLVPILHRVPEKGQPMHEKVAATNWVYMREEDDFDATMPKLVEAINTDLDWVRQHTRLLERAVEWDRKKRNGSFLLHGTDLDEAEQWMGKAGGEEDRQVTSLQAEYIHTSRQQATKRQRTLLAGVSIAMIVSVFLAIAAIVQRGAAIANEELAKNNAATAVANEKLANDNALLAQNNASTAIANEELAENNAATAVANEHARATQQAIAIANEQLAKENELLAIAQRGGAQAKLVQQQPSQLFVSTLLALHSLSISPSEIGEEVLRQNLSLLPVPLTSFQQGSEISSTDFSPDGENIISTGENSIAYVWNSNTGDVVAELTHDEAVRIGLYSPDGSWIATGSEDGAARIWNATDYSLTATYVPPANTPDELKDVADMDISPDGQYLAVGRGDGRVTVIELATGKTIRILPNPGYTYDVVFSPNGQRLAVATSENTMTVWHPLTGISYVSAKHNGEVYQAAFSPDSKFVVTASEDQTSQALLINSGRKTTTLLHDDWVEAVAYNPYGNNFATAADDYTVRLWDAEDYREILRMRHGGFVQYVTYDPFGWWLASSSHDGTARVWNPASGQEVIRIPLYGEGGPVAFSPDGSRLLTSNVHGELRTWDISQLDSLLLSIENDELVRSVSFSNDGHWLASGTDDGLIQLWDIKGIFYGPLDGEESLSRTIYKLGEGFIRNLLFNPGSPDLSIVGDNTLAIVNLENLSEVQEKYYSYTLFARGDYRPDGNILAIANGEDETISLYDPYTSKLLKLLTQPGGAYAPGFDPLNEDVLAVGGNGQVSLWSVSEGVTLTTVEHPGKILDVVFSHDGQLLAVGGHKGDVSLWHVKHDGNQISLELNYRIKSPSITNDIEFNPDDTLIATANEDGMVYIWDVSHGEELSRLRHPLSVRRISFSGDGNLLASASGKLIFLWDMQAISTFKASDLVDTACERLTRNLSEGEWLSLELPGERQLICPNFP